MDRMEKLKSFLQDNPSDSFLKHALALEYVKIGEVKEAKELFLDILNHEPGYIASYYQLGKLLENSGETNEAIKIYEKGMDEAKKAGDRHSFNELQAAHQDLVF